MELSPASPIANKDGQEGAKRGNPVRDNQNIGLVGVWGKKQLSNHVRVLELRAIGLYLVNPEDPVDSPRISHINADRRSS